MITIILLCTYMIYTHIHTFLEGNTLDVTISIIKNVCFSFFKSFYVFQIFYNKHFYNYRNVNNIKWLIETHFTMFTNYPTEIAPCYKSSQRDAKAYWILKRLNCQQGHNTKPPTETLVSFTQHRNFLCVQSLTVGNNEKLQMRILIESIFHHAFSGKIP